MKKLLFLLAPVALFFSCNTEIPAEQYRAQSKKQCVKQIAGKFLEDTATEEDKDKFCDCYAQYMVGDAEMVTTGEMIKKATKVEELEIAMEACKAEVNGSNIIDDITEGVDAIGDAIEETVEDIKN